MRSVRENVKGVGRGLRLLARDTLSLKGFWVLLPVIGTMGLAYLAKSEGWGFGTKRPNEVFAVVMMSACTGAFLLRAFLRKTALDLFLLVMSANFLCREIHFTGTGDGVFYVTGIAAAGAFLWQKEIFEALSESFLQRVLLSGTVWSYFVSFLIQRRVFKPRPSLWNIEWLPSEQMMHVRLEEMTESLAHTLFFLAGICVWFCRRRPEDPGGVRPDGHP